MCLAQGHNAVTPLSLEPATPQSQVKHSTSEPLRPIWRVCMFAQARLSLRCSTMLELLKSHVLAHLCF